MPVRTMGLYLARWGFTPQKPIKKAYERSPAAVQKWLNEEYPAIAACAKVRGAACRRMFTKRQCKRPERG